MLLVRRKDLDLMSVQVNRKLLSRRVIHENHHHVLDDHARKHEDGNPEYGSDAVQYWPEGNPGKQAITMFSAEWRVR